MLAEKVSAKDNVPPFRASIMDGYALSSGEVGEYDILKEKSLAGGNPTVKGEEGTAVYVTTGAPVPEGFTCVVPIEDCIISENKVSIKTHLPPNKWIRAIGCDISIG